MRFNATKTENVGYGKHHNFVSDSLPYKGFLPFFVFDTKFSKCHQSLPVGLHPFPMVSNKLNHMAAHISL